ncbi:hypothetical protein JW979_04400 [bacterium]|nr:hypothetical protein [candidate division CSSED10-310 bacterium]
MKINIFLKSILAMVFIYTNPVFALPEGYDQTNLTPPISCSGILGVFMNDQFQECVLFGHASSGKSPHNSASRNTRGASDEIWQFNTVTETYSPFYQSELHSAETYQIKSASDVYIDTSTLPLTFYIADQDPYINPWEYGGLWKAQDLNSDNDIDDENEMLLLTPAISGFLTYITGVVVDTSSGNVFASEAAGPGDTLIYLCDDIPPEGNGNGVFDLSEIHSYFTHPGTSYGYGAFLTFDHLNPQIIYTIDSAGTFYQLEDSNENGVIDTDEYLEFPLLFGGFGIATDPDGHIFASASEWQGNHALFQITPGNPPVAVLYDDLTEQASWMGSVKFGTGTSFEPYVKDTKLYVNYTDPSGLDPNLFLSYQGSLPEVPSLSIASGIFGMIIIGYLVFRKKP